MVRERPHPALTPGWRQHSDQRVGRGFRRGWADTCAGDGGATLGRCPRLACGQTTRPPLPPAPPSPPRVTVPTVSSAGHRAPAPGAPQAALLPSSPRPTTPAACSCAQAASRAPPLPTGKERVHPTQPGLLPAPHGVRCWPSVSRSRCLQVQASPATGAPDGQVAGQQVEEGR